MVNRTIGMTIVAVALIFGISHVNHHGNAAHSHDHGPDSHDVHHHDEGHGEEMKEGLKHMHNGQEHGEGHDHSGHDHDGHDHDH